MRQRRARRGGGRAAVSRARAGRPCRVTGSACPRAAAARRAPAWPCPPCLRPRSPMRAAVHPRCAPAAHGEPLCKHAHPRPQPDGGQGRAQRTPPGRIVEILGRVRRAAVDDARVGRGRPRAEHAGAALLVRAQDHPVLPTHRVLVHVRVRRRALRRAPGARREWRQWEEARTFSNDEIGLVAERVPAAQVERGVDHRVVRREAPLAAPLAPRRRRVALRAVHDRVILLRLLPKSEQRIGRVFWQRDREVGSGGARVPRVAPAQAGVDLHHAPVVVHDRRAGVDGDRVVRLVVPNSDWQPRPVHHVARRDVAVDGAAPVAHSEVVLVEQVVHAVLRVVHRAVRVVDAARRVGDVKSWRFFERAAGRGAELDARAAGPQCAIGRVAVSRALPEARVQEVPARHEAGREAERR